jgi:6-phospho-3-hexuloisomerase
VGQEITDLLGRVDAAAFARLVAAFENADRRWFLTGQGRSGLVARMAAMRLMHLGRQAHVTGEATAPSIRDGDGLLIVSGSGETSVSVGFAGVAKAEGARVALLTHSAASTLARVADPVLVLPVEASAQLGGSLFEQGSLIVLDAVILELARRIPGADARMRHRHANLQ